MQPPEIVKFFHACEALLGTRALYLSVLKLRFFRNLGHQELSFPPEGVAIVGPNAQGKSNLLEAIYYLETFRSFRGAPSEQMIAFGEDVFRVSTSVASAKRPGGVSMEVAAAYEASSGRRKVTIDGAEPARIGDAVGRLGAVIFSPADVAIVNDGPARRRRFLDVVLSLNATGYLTVLQQYKHALAQRNAALKGEQPASVIRAWDEPLGRSAASVMLARHLWVEEWREAFRSYYEVVSGGPSASMAYVPNVSVGTWDASGVHQAYHEALEAGWSRDLRYRNTGAGPHRDELLLSLTDSVHPTEVRVFGSGGQRRTAALALRLVEGDGIRRARDTEPILLLDDAFAELDEARRERALQLMDSERFGQVILTAPKESDVPLQGDALSRWGISDGRICA